jgi:hypothetical protein
MDPITLGAIAATLGLVCYRRRFPVVRRM